MWELKPEKVKILAGAHTTWKWYIQDLNSHFLIPNGALLPWATFIHLIIHVDVTAYHPHAGSWEDINKVTYEVLEPRGLTRPDAYSRNGDTVGPGLLQTQKAAWRTLRRLPRGGDV